MSQDNVAVGLDIGTDKVTALIGKLDKNQTIKYIGVGECQAMGLKKGCIVDIDGAMKSIEQALSMAQSMAGMRVEAVYVNTIVDPETDFQDVAVENVIKSVNRLGISIRELILTPVAVAESVLNMDEKRKGAILVDIGSGTTDIAVFDRGNLVYAVVLPVGGAYITSDLAFGLRTNPFEAEKIKIEHGSVLPEVALEYDFVEISDLKEKRKVSQKHISDIIQPRVEEILLLAKNAIISGHRPKSNPIVVLTGGTSQLPRIQELANKILGWPVVLAQDVTTIRNSQAINRPSYAVALGLVNYGINSYQASDNKTSYKNNDGMLSKMKKWLREYI